MPGFRGQILQSCIYGVDIDGQAVEVTIMSLYLKMLEGKLSEHWQRDMLEARLLPPLDNNVRCGNSLISQTDFDRYWENEFKDLFGGDEDVRFRINAFDWTSQTRGFGTQQVFRGVTTYTSIRVFQQGRTAEHLDYACIEDLVDGEAQCRALDFGGEPHGIKTFKAVHPEDGNDRFVFLRVGQSVRRLMEAWVIPGTPYLIPAEGYSGDTLLNSS